MLGRLTRISAENLHITIHHLGASLGEQHTAGLYIYSNLSWHTAGFLTGIRK